MLPPRRLLAALVLLAATACSAGPARSGPPATGSPPSGGLAWSPCERGFECAELAVPLGEGTTQLAVTRLPADGPRVGALVVNPGGPGVSAVDSLQASARGFPAVLRSRFDLVAFDPRGVGRSSAVTCGTTAELDRYWALDPSPDDATELGALERGTAELVQGCADRSGAVLPQVSTAEVAEDLERLRAALGDEPLNYLGYSYGTAIGAAYLDAHPTRVRTMLLDGALDPTLTWDGFLAGQSAGFDAALRAMLDDCARVSCAFRTATSGDLGAAFDALAAGVETSPLAAGGGRAVGPGEFTLAVGAGLYDRVDGWPALAAALAAGERGDGRALLALSDSYLDRTAGRYLPTTQANLAVNCIDRPWPRDPQAYVDLAAQLARDAPRFGPAIALSGLPCATWPVAPVSTPHPVRGSGAPPVVVLGTTGDPATPYAWAVALAAQLDSGVLVTHVGDGHTAFHAGAAQCLLAPLQAYLVDATAPAAFTC